ncbi:hypothetical protein [Flavobacterium sp. A45]|uniref:hypothetical protein n=1 Tax=Flavobacterium sp. A45 TaxID=1945862 RepID=UPI000F5029C5|nr:hypothetical protein [Flavobacterium sp. A45]
MTPNKLIQISSPIPNRMGFFLDFKPQRHFTWLLSGYPTTLVASSYPSCVCKTICIENQLFFPNDARLKSVC